MLITAKGQVTIPQKFRTRLGLLPHTEVEFDIVGNELRIRKARENTVRGKKIVQHLAGRNSIQMSTDEIMRLTRGDE
ncbi:MAG: AbrB/MazE/SpoVT family DNA-binding domain-containing protein [Caldilineaceae bacterium]